VIVQRPLAPGDPYRCVTRSRCGTVGTGISMCQHLSLRASFCESTTAQSSSLLSEERRGCVRPTEDCPSDMLVTSCARFSTRGGVVNIYDPADQILYVHMARETDSCSTPRYSGSRCNRLPAGYANRSLRTRLEKTVHMQVVETGISTVDRRRRPGMSSPASSQPKPGSKALRVLVGPGNASLDPRALTTSSTLRLLASGR
jgi:hypothetical protein